MSCPAVMYSVDKNYDLEGKVKLPTVMYQVYRLYPDPGAQAPSPATLGERQENLLKKLDSLIADASSMLTESSSQSPTSPPAMAFLNNDCPLDIVIRVDPSRPPRWLGQVKKQLDDKGISTWWKFHTHSSVRSPPSSDVFPVDVPHQGRHQYQLIITVIWTGEGPVPSLHINPCLRTVICGETNIFRFFGRILGLYDVSPVDDATIDLCLYNCDVILDQSSKQKCAALSAVAKSIEKGMWSASTSGLVSAFVASVLVGFGLENIPVESLKKWTRENGSLLIFS